MNRQNWEWQYAFRFNLAAINNNIINVKINAGDTSFKNKFGQIFWKI